MGLGGGALPHFHLVQYPGSHVDSVEIDPAVVQLAKKDFFVVNDRHTILECDGFATLAQQDKKYDIIWMDQFTPKEGPKATVSAQYLKILRDHLKPDGMLVVHLGMAKSAKTFSETIRGYQSGFENAVRIEGPAPSAQSGFDPMPALAALSSDKKAGKNATLLLPEHVVAVSNNKALNCAHFWEIYKKWTQEKLIDLQWSEQSRAASCEDLHG
jgi:spermidine synthase